MKNKIVLSGLLLAGSLYAADVSFSGFIDADMAGDIVTDSKVEFQSNLEIDLTTTITFTDKVSVEVYTTAVTGTLPYGGGEVGERWPSMDFDGVTLIAETDIGTLLVGDLVYTTGNLGYYAYKRPGFYAAGLTETFVRGVGLETNGFTIYTGSLDTDFNLAGLFLSYELSLMEGFSVSPYFSTNHGSGEYPIYTGLEFALEGDFSLSGSANLLKEPGKDASLTFLAEPSFAVGQISFDAALYLSMVSDDTDKVTELSIPDEYFFYIEPGIELSPTTAFGLPLELHGGEKGVKDETFWIVPTLYMYPADGVEWWLWAGSVIDVSSKKEKDDVAWSFGSELIINF